jgi:hypothetical protein
MKSPTTIESIASMFRSIDKKICVLLLLAAPAYAGTVMAIVGVNAVNPQNLSEQQQDAMVAQLAANHVKTIRLPLANASSVHMIVKAYRQGIGAIVIVSPTAGSAKATQDARPIDRPLTSWSATPLSDADPDGFERWLTPLLAALEQAGVKLTALEIGNELNSAGYNGDFLVPGTKNVPGNGRILGFDDLERGWKAWFNKQPITDPEASNLAKGFYVYLSILDAARNVCRSTSPLNRETPIISAGAVYNTKLPLASKTPDADGPSDGVPSTDFIRFLRQHGLDNHVDGYGMHVYYSTVDNIQKALSICSTSGGKPCWLTEWGGFSTKNASCSAGQASTDDSVRLALVSKVRATLKPFVTRGALVNSMYYSWNSGGNIYIPECNTVTPSGALAIRPLD